MKAMLIGGPCDGTMLDIVKADAVLVMDSPEGVETLRMQRVHDEISYEKVVSTGREPYNLTNDTEPFIYEWAGSSPEPHNGGAFSREQAEKMLRWSALYGSGPEKLRDIARSNGIFGYSDVDFAEMSAQVKKANEAIMKKAVQDAIDTIVPNFQKFTTQVTATAVAFEDAAAKFRAAMAEVDDMKLCHAYCQCPGCRALRNKNTARRKHR